MWAELDDMAPEDQVVACGEWITKMTQEVLPKLGKVRRQRIVEILHQEGWDAIRLAETIGARPSTISRLASEGRANRKGAHVP
jgi:hypothetical protein